MAASTVLYPSAFFALPFDAHTPQGSVAFHDAFGADGRQEGAGDAS
jgi:putative acetyltransferase